MTQIIQAIRGMNDILPAETFLWQQAENTIRQVLQSQGFEEIRTPIVEKTELFKRSIGEVTDIVEKEMYTFLDRNEDSLTLRPEGTAGVVRAGIEHGLLYNQIRRLWYTGPYFRHERPQKGRYRQFYQSAVEIFGLPGPDIDAELIFISATILEQLGILSHTQLELNTLGTPEVREKYRGKLVSYLQQHQEALDEDSKRRLTQNPLRILDSKNPAMQSIIQSAPQLMDHLDDESLDHFQKLQHYLKQLHIPFIVNPSLVRGLDYYTKTVFEWTTDKLGSQSAIIAGGRYDGLVGQLGGKPTPALGFALGLERIILLMQQINTESPSQGLHVYLIPENENAYPESIKLAYDLRNHISDLRTLVHSGGGNLKSQMKKADKSGALFAIILSEQAIKTDAFLLKTLREDVLDQTVTKDKLVELLKLKLAKKKEI